MFVFLEAEEGPLGAIGGDLGSIRGAFWGHFGDFFRIRGIFKNISFTEVNRYFLRFGRVLDDPIVTFSCCVFESILLQYFESNFEDLLSFRVPIGLQLGLFGGPFGAKLVHIL